MNAQYYYIVHAAFLLLAMSYLIRDVLYLRAMAIVSASCMIAFNVLAYPEPIWVIIGWNIAFMVINAGHIIRIANERVRIRFTGQERELYDILFPYLAQFEFKKLIGAAHWEDVPAGRTLSEQGQLSSAIHLIYSGSAEVVAKGKNVVNLRDGAFVGEMGFLTDKLASATVVTSGPCRLVSWRKQELRHLLVRNPAMRVTLQNILARDVVRKLSI